MLVVIYMDLIHFWSEAVPCLSEIRDSEEQERLIEDTPLFKNPRYIYRFEDGKDRDVTIAGGVVWPLLSGDEELADVLRQTEIRPDDLSPPVLNKLLSTKTLVREYGGEPLIQERTDPLSAVKVNYELTWACPNNCQGCFNKTQVSSQPDLETLKKRSQKLSDFGIMYVELTGGDPFIRKDMPQIAQIVRESEMGFYVVTSAFNLAEQDPSWLRHAMAVCVSLDGDEHYHDLYRNNQGLYRRVLDGLEFLHGHNIPCLISSTISNENKEYISHMVDVAREYNATIILRRMFPTQRAIDHGIKMLDGEFGDYDSVEGIINALSIPKKTERSRFYGCDFGSKHFCVTPDGDAISCLFLRDSYIANVDKDDKEYFREAIESARARNTDVVPHCQPCEYRSDGSCGGLCYASSKRREWIKDAYMS
jgi:radical SAM protein with 4Fe4S-binding SPASM domain